MFTIKLKYLIPPGLIVILSGGASPSFVSRFTDPCSDLTIKMRNLTLEELVARSDYIGIYQANKGVYSKNQIFEFTKTYTYKLSSYTPLKGAPPNTILLKGEKPTKKITSYDFTVFRFHDAVDPKHVGINYWPERLRKSKKCQYAPSFRIGFNYLIFSYGSGMSYEPVFSQTYDNWYKMVEAEVKKQRLEGSGK